MKLEITQTWKGESIESSEVTSVELRPGRTGLEIRVDAPFSGDPSPPGPPGAFWGLWEHEVVEVFVCGEGERYTEIEMGPHGHHLVLCLNGVRRVEKQELPLDFSVTHVEDRWEGLARLDWCWMPPGPHRINAYAIRGQGRERRFLAWQPVPGETPDFHRLECFSDVGRNLCTERVRASGPESE